MAAQHKAWRPSPWEQEPHNLWEPRVPSQLSYSRYWGSFDATSSRRDSLLSTSTTLSCASFDTDASEIRSRCSDCGEHLTCIGCPTFGGPGQKRFKMASAVGYNNDCDLSSRASSRISVESNSRSDISAACGSLHDIATAALYCDNCSEPVCSDCLPLEHRGHEVNQLQDASERASIANQMLLSEAKSGLRSAMASVSAAVEKKKSLTLQKQLVEKEIQAFTEQQHARVNEREKYLLNELTAIAAARSDIIDQEISSFKELANAYMTVSNRITNVIGSSKAQDTLRTKELCTREMAKIKEIQESTVFQDIEMTFVHPDKETLRTLSSMGRVAELPTSPNVGSVGDEVKRSREALSIIQTSFPQSTTSSKTNSWSSQLQLNLGLKSILSSAVSTPCLQSETKVQPKSTLGSVADPESSSDGPYKFALASNGTDVQPKRPDRISLVNGNKSNLRPWAGQLKLNSTIGDSVTPPIVKNEAKSQPKTVPTHTPSPLALAPVPAIRVSDYSKVGTSKFVFGSEGVGNGQLCRPWGVCCDREGKIIVADRSNHRIQIFSPEGRFLSKFGSHGKNQGQFDRPAGVAVDSASGRIVVADKDNHRIQVFTDEGRFLFTFGELGSREGQFNYPWDVAVSKTGQIVVTDTRNRRIQMFTKDGLFIDKYGFENVGYNPKHFDSPRGISFLKSGNIIVTDFNNHRLVVIERNFKKAFFLGSEGVGPNQFHRPQGIAVDDEGNIVVADSRNHRIQVFRESGSYLCQFGTNGSQPGQFDRPSGICLTPNGLIVVVDFGNNRVQVF